MQLLDLDAEATKAPVEFSVLAMGAFAYLSDPDWCSDDNESLESAAQAVVILRAQFASQSRVYTAVGEWIEAIACDIERETREHLSYNIRAPQLYSCSRCLSSLGKFPGGGIVYGCAYCYDEDLQTIKAVKPLATEWPGPFAGWIPARIFPIEPYNQTPHWGEIFQARLIHKFFSRT